MRERSDAAYSINAKDQPLRLDAQIKGSGHIPFFLHRCCDKSQCIRGQLRYQRGETGGYRPWRSQLPHSSVSPGPSVDFIFLTSSWEIALNVLPSGSPSTTMISISSFPQGCGDELMVSFMRAASFRTGIIIEHHTGVGIQNFLHLTERAVLKSLRKESPLGSLKFARPMTMLS